MSIENVIPSYTGPNFVNTKKGNEFRKSNTWLSSTICGVALDYSFDSFGKKEAKEISNAVKGSGFDWKKLGNRAVKWAAFGIAFDICINMYRSHKADKASKSK